MDGELAAWIAELSARLERGDPEGPVRVDIGRGTDAMPADPTILIMPV